MDHWRMVVPEECRICLYCNRSMSSNALDGTEVLVCFDVPGHHNQEMIVGEDETCENFC